VTESRSEFAWRDQPIGPTSVLCLVLCAVVLAAYGGMSDHRFLRHWDDPDYVTRNPIVASGLTSEGLRSALTSPVQGNWQPLTLLSHMWDVERHGMDPVGHHRTSVWLHAANSVLFFLALWLLTRSGPPRPSGGAWKFPRPMLRCAFAAAIFGLHPLHVESVAWVAERKDVLSGFFFFLLLIAYARYVASPSPMRYAAIVVALVLGLMSKSMLVTAPLLLLLLDYWPLGRMQLGDGTICDKLVRMRPLWSEKLILFVPSLVFSYVSIATQSSANTVVSLDRLPPLDRVANAIAAYGVYLFKFAVPIQLSPFYPLPSLIETPLQVWLRVAAAALGVVALLAITWRFRNRAPHAIVGFLWFVIMLIPVIGLTRVGDQAWADRYMYLPMGGLILACSWSIFDWIDSSPHYRARWFRTTCLIGGLVLLAALGSLTSKQVQSWSNSERLWQHALKLEPRNFRAAFNLAQLRFVDRNYTGALRYLRKAEAAAPESIAIQRSLGLVNLRLGRNEDAYRQLRAALVQMPDDAELHHSLALIAIERGELSEAARSLKRARSLEPENPRYRAGVRSLKTD
jgi:Flp pilus assembly protein TadD